MTRGTVAGSGRKLLIVGCSGAKKSSSGLLPALDRYDGPAYRVMRTFLRVHHWPDDVSVGILSAEHGLFGIFKNIENYNKRMDRTTAESQAPTCTSTLAKWMPNHKSVHISVGKDYMPAIQPGLDKLNLSPVFFEGGIGRKLKQVKTFFHTSQAVARVKPQVEAGSGQCLYFLPDWDDVLDPAFDFEADAFSAPRRSDRQDRHCSWLMKPDRMSDGMLISLAQCETSKGPLKLPERHGIDSLYLPSIRQHFGLDAGQYLFGDCGAFTYVTEDYPTMTVDRAVALYESYGFDFGAAVDHIPVKAIFSKGNRRHLSKSERQKRIDITDDNAAAFIENARQRKAQFIPVGILHGLDSDAYRQSVSRYYEYGYRHMAIGGLVPQSDLQVKRIVKAVMSEAGRMPTRPWIHLFGIYRPKLQSLFRELKVDSFDSATYFRKAWLRSDQNYLSADGEWFAAIRVPMTSDGRTRRKLEDANIDIEALRQEETHVLHLLCQYDRDEAELNDVLEAVLNYDAHLSRCSETHSMRSRYRRTLEERPWRNCGCNFCRAIGIHMLIFRGANRNKRRGAHNTLMLYENVKNVGRQ